MSPTLESRDGAGTEDGVGEGPFVTTFVGTIVAAEAVGVSDLVGNIVGLSFHGLLAVNPDRNTYPTKIRLESPMMIPMMELATTALRLRAGGGEVDAACFGGGADGGTSLFGGGGGGAD